MHPRCKCGHINKDGWYICEKCGAKRYEAIDVDMKNPAPDMQHREQETKRKRQLDTFPIVCSTIAIIISLIAIIKSLY